MSDVLGDGVPWDKPSRPSRRPPAARSILLTHTRKWNFTFVSISSRAPLFTELLGGLPEITVSTRWGQKPHCEELRSGWESRKYTWGALSRCLEGKGREGVGIGSGVEEMISFGWGGGMGA